jgi:two-component SAPR family response regulator
MHIISVDDERPAIDNFRLTTAHFREIKELHTFQSGEEALDFAKKNTVDAAFLDMEMPGIHGLDLARALKAHDPNIRVIFVTAYRQYALDAFGVDASGYLLKPYTAADIRKELAKCTYKPLPSNRVVIQTIPMLSVTVDGVPLRISGAKPREMLALLIDRGERGFTVGEGIACLWPDRAADSNTQALCRMTWKRLSEVLTNAGVGDIIATTDNRRYLKVDAVECDLYRILAGDKQAARMYSGSYLQEYEWAEERNAQLYSMLNGT